MKKEYWKIVAAAVFLTVAGFCYSFARGQRGLESLPGKGETVSQEESGFSESANVPGLSASVGAGESLDLQTAGEDQKMEPEQSTEETPLCWVYICGEVENPGVYELAEGSRIFEAVEAAGGFTSGADERLLNLAAPVEDGMQIVVYNVEEAMTAAAPVSKTGSESGAKNGRINLNTASKEELMTLTGIGESRARDIVRYREESGGFSAIEDIMNVPGIKDASFQKIKDRITV